MKCGFGFLLLGFGLLGTCSAVQVLRGGDDQPAKNEVDVGNMHTGGHVMDAPAEIQHLLAGIGDSSDMKRPLDGIIRLLKSTPLQDLLDIVRPEIDKMQTQILDAKANAQSSLNAIDEAFKKCSTNKGAGEGEAEESKKTFEGKRQPHLECREGEEKNKVEYDGCVKTMKALEETKKVACAALEQAIKTPNVNLIPTPQNGEAYKDWLARVKVWVDAEVVSVGKKESECNYAKSNYTKEKERCTGLSGSGGLKKVWEDKKLKCDEAQTALEAASCDYYSKLKETQSGYSECTKTTKDLYDGQRPNIEQEEENRKTEFRAVQRIKCLLNVWGAQGNSVDKAKFQECVAKTYSASQLDLQYPNLQVGVPITLPEYPCTAGFVTAEYGSLTTNAPNKACTPCSGAAAGGGSGGQPNVDFNVGQPPITAPSSKLVDLPTTINFDSATEMWKVEVKCKVNDIGGTNILVSLIGGGSGTRLATAGNGLSVNGFKGAQNFLTLLPGWQNPQQYKTKPHIFRFEWSATTGKHCFSVDGPGVPNGEGKFCRDNRPMFKGAFHTIVQGAGIDGNGRTFELHGEYHWLKIYYK